MRIEIVHDHDDFLGLRKMNINQVTHTMSKINHSTLVGDFDMSPRFQWCEKDEQIAGTIALIFIVVLGQSPRFGQQSTELSTYFVDKEKSSINPVS